MGKLIIRSIVLRILQEEIFGPIVSVTTFKTTEEAILYGLGQGVWARDAHEHIKFPKELKQVVSG